MRYKIWNFKLKRFLTKSELENFSVKFTKNGDLSDQFYIYLKSSEMWDKNGKEIYEGDILNINGNLSVVEYFSQAFRVLEGDYLANTYSHTDSGFKEISNSKVVGNIYENPQLVANKKHRK